MTTKYFETLNSSFLAHFARRLADLIIEQGSELLRDLELTTPTTSISTLLFIANNANVTVATIAEELGVSHQMATQRINLLEKLLLIERQPLPNDKRAKQVTLTELGKAEVKILFPFTQQMKEIFEQLEAEVGCELTKVIRRTELSLLNKSIKERLKASIN